MSKGENRIPQNTRGLRGRFLMRCHCGNEYEAKGADLGRGWGFSCSKSCSSSRRQNGYDKAKIIQEIALSRRPIKPKPKAYGSEIILMDAETGEVISVERR